MTDMNHDIWMLVQNVIGTELDNGLHEDDILKHVMIITHGIVEYDAVRREIARQKRMVMN